MFTNRFAKSPALLGVADRFFERGAGDAEAARRDVQALALKPGHYLLEACAFAPADQVLCRHAEVFKQHLAGLQAFVTQLINVAADGQSRDFAEDIDHIARGALLDLFFRDDCDRRRSRRDRFRQLGGCDDDCLIELLLRGEKKKKGQEFHDDFPPKRERLLRPKRPVSWLPGRPPHASLPAFAVGATRAA